MNLTNTIKRLTMIIVGAFYSKGKQATLSMERTSKHGYLSSPLQFNRLQAANKHDSMTATDQPIKRMQNLTGLLALSIAAWSHTPTALANQKPTQLFQQQSIPLSSILNEWKAKGLNANTYLCVCDQTLCDTRPSWPFRPFKTGEAIPVLGEFNRDQAKRQGFICARTTN